MRGNRHLFGCLFALASLMCACAGPDSPPTTDVGANPARPGDIEIAVTTTSEPEEKGSDSTRPPKTTTTTTTTSSSAPQSEECILVPGTAAWPIQTPDDRAFFDAYELGAGKNGIGCLTGTWQQVGAWRIMTATGDDAGAIVELNGFYWPIQSAYVQPLQNVLEQAPGGGVRTITFINDGRGDRFLISLANGGCTMLHRNQYHEISESGEAIEVVHYLDQALLKAATRFLDDAPGVQVFWIEANTSETEWKVRYREVEENRWTEGVDPFQLRRRSDGAIVLASESAVFDTDPGDCPIDLRLREVLAADG